MPADTDGYSSAHEENSHQSANRPAPRKASKLDLKAAAKPAADYPQILSTWQRQLQTDLPNQSEQTHEAIAQWLIGEPTRFESMSPAEIKLATQAMDYRYRILISRYWGLSPARGYQRLLQKLGGLFLIRSKVRTWIALSRDRKRAVKDVLQEVIQEMLQSDRFLRSQAQWIGQCTHRASLRNLLTLATIEEYCLRPIRNQPLLVYRFVNYLRRSQRGGMTQVPSNELIQLISEELGTDDTDSTLSLLDFEALDRYEVQKEIENQQAARQLVKQQFSEYLQEKLGDTAVQWLHLHLQGYAQDSISRQLGLNVREAYRLREKVSYHAIRIFTLKEQPDLVFSWLKTSLVQHNLGLTAQEWDRYWESLKPAQQKMLTAFKAGEPIEAIAKSFELTPKQVTSQWAELYLLSQAARGASSNP
ncbi:HetZ-related protein 2 [cf. Phormidesmis sp. LEGE 11477]|nr:HetZ-related protein 2 [cf. Phormidesmis sp. LEGE 11477]